MARSSRPVKGNAISHSFAFLAVCAQMLRSRWAAAGSSTVSFTGLSSGTAESFNLATLFPYL